MKLGFISYNFSEEVLQKAARMGYDCLEISADRGSALCVDTLTDDDCKRVAELKEKHGISFESVFSNVNHMAGDPAERKENMAYFIRLIQNARKLGSGLVMTNVWANPSLSPVDNIPVFKQVFTEYTRAAEDAGVRIVVENCPHASALVNEYPFTIGNICYSPEMWDMMFDAVPSKALGIEYDPSHCVWLFIDYMRALREYKDRIYSCHAKDTEIDYNELGRVGIMNPQGARREGWLRHGWWRYRMPGMGEINWEAFCKALHEAGCEGPMFVEHEDPVYGGERYDEALEMCHALLRPLV